jgi:tetratricopeptide (TPR) repeat protein
MSSDSETCPISDQPTKFSNCVACQELINPKATICPHCESPQHPEKWAIFGTFLKIVGGISAVFSLIIVATEVSNLASEGSNRKTVAKELVKAAELLWEVEDKNAALSLLDKAETVLPGFHNANTLRTNIGIATISRIFPLVRDRGLRRLLTDPNKDGVPYYRYYDGVSDNDLKLILKKVSLPESLARKAEDSKGDERARSLAYLAWAMMIQEYLEGNVVEINKIFKKALEASKNDPVTNLLMAAWLASDYYKDQLDYADRIKQSKALFKKSLAYSGNKPDDINGLYLKRWIRALQFETLPAFEALEVIQEMLSNKEPLPKEQTLPVTRNLFISLTGRGGAPNEKRVKQTEADLLSRFKPKALVEISIWLASIHYGCSSNGRCTDTNHESAQMLFAIGRMYELDGNQSKAHSYYQYAKQQTELSGWWTSSFLDAIQRTVPKSPKH